MADLSSTFLPDHVWAAIAGSLDLSEREADIAKLLMADMSERAIAENLRISSHTVHTHLERLYRKLNARSRCQVVVRIFEQYVQLDNVDWSVGQTPTGCRFCRSTGGDGGAEPIS